MRKKFLLSFLCFLIQEILSQEFFDPFENEDNSILPTSANFSNLFNNGIPSLMRNHTSFFRQPYFDFFNSDYDDDYDYNNYDNSYEDDNYDQNYDDKYNDNYDDNYDEDYDEDYESDDYGNQLSRRKKCRPCACGLKFKRKIVNGKPAKKYEFPWVVLLTLKHKFFCGGSVITDRHILTAGHCTAGIGKNPLPHLRVRFLEWNRSKPSETRSFLRKVVQIIRPKDFNLETLFHDIALLRINKRVGFGGHFLRPICLPIRGHTYAKQRGVVAGWGLTSDEGKPAFILQKLAVKIFPNGRCRRTEYGNMIKPSMICAGFIKGGASTCQGDSGGALMARDEGRYRVVGVVSFGEKCAQPNAPSVFTRVTKFVKWIRKYTKGDCYCKD